MASIHLPKNTGELIELAGKIVERYESSAQKSAVEKADIEWLKAKLATVKPRYEQMLEHRQKASELNLEIQSILGTHNLTRKITPGTVRFMIASVRDLLKGRHRDNLSELSQWGFEVSEPRSYLEKMDR